MSFRVSSPLPKKVGLSWAKEKEGIKMTTRIFAPESESWSWDRREANGSRTKLCRQLESVIQKDFRFRVEERLREEHGLDGDDVPAIAATCAAIVWTRASSRAPNQLWTAAPGGEGPGSRRFARRTLRPVTLTAIDPDDLLIWYECGLPAMQRARLLRTLEEFHRQGAQIRLCVLATLFNLTVNAAKERLRPLREAGVRLPYHGRSHAQYASERIGRLWHAVEQVIKGVDSHEICDVCGLSSRGLSSTVRWWRRVVRRRRQGESVAAVAASEGLTTQEVQEAEALLEAHARADEQLVSQAEGLTTAWPLRHYAADGDAAQMERVLSDYLLRRHRWSARRLTRLFGELRESHAGLATERRDDELLFEAASHHAPLGRSLLNCEVEAVRLNFASTDFGSENQPTITEVKRRKLRRFVRLARNQNALITNTDLCYLLGVHMDVVGRLLREEDAETLPTRQREWDRRNLWFDALMSLAEAAARGESLQIAARETPLSPNQAVEGVRQLVSLARRLEEREPMESILVASRAPQWLVERLASHPNLSRIAHMGDLAEARAANG